MSIEIIRGNVRVELEHIGEGYGGDYEPDDPDDRELLRFTVSLVTPREDDPDFPHDASYCTNLPADLSEDDQRRVAEAIMRRVRDDVEGGMSIKRTCEDLSWLDESDVKRLRDDGIVTSTAGDS